MTVPEKASDIVKPKSQPWAIVAFGFLALALASCGRATLSLLIPVWQKEFGWTSDYISSVGAAALLLIALVAPFAGRPVDRMGPRFTLNLGLGMLGIGCAVVATMNGKAMFVLGYPETPAHFTALVNCILRDGFRPAVQAGVSLGAHRGAGRWRDSMCRQT